MALDLVGQVTGMRDRRVAATWLQGWTIHWALGPVLIAWLDERRVAPIDAWGMALAWDGQTPLVWLADGAWAGLPDDPLARAGGDLIVADDPGTLTAILRERIEAFLTPWIAAFHAAGQVGRRQQWLQSADRMAMILQAAGEGSGRAHEAVEAARRLLDRPGSPLWSARGRFVACPVGSALLPRSSGFVYQRATCCLAFKASDGELCPTCPVRRDHAHGAGTTSGAQSPWLGDCSREPS